MQRHGEGGNIYCKILYIGRRIGPEDVHDLTIFLAFVNDREAKTSNAHAFYSAK